MEFRILGPVEVAAGQEGLELGGPRQQIVLAVLLLGAGGLVTVDRLEEAVYGEDLPPTARAQVQMSVSSLRRMFAGHGQDALIATRPQGYVLHLGGTDWLDSAQFAERATAAGVAREAGRLEEAAAGYRDALRLWRGRALEGLDSQLLQAAAARLDEQRVAVTEDRIGVELDLGRHHELTGELAELVEEFPLRDRLRGQLMLALYRCGRAAEALAAYRRAREAMVEELGIEPGAELQRLEHAILASDPALAPPGLASASAQPTGPDVVPAADASRARPAGARPPERQVPRLLPAAVADFTDREEEAGVIRRYLADTDGSTARLAAPVVVITGLGGVGKTSLAVHAAHGLADRFGHGQLFADLHGCGPEPVGPAVVLERFLRALGVPGPQIPGTVDERAEAYRNLLAGRRVLVVLDDAASESQVAPLLPGSAAAAVLVTSRGWLTGLPGALHVELDVLDPGSSVQMLAGIAGARRVRADGAAATAIARYCGHLPLALRIVGARLAARPHWEIGQLAGRLAGQAGRLDELRHGDLAVRATISMSYEAATGKAQRLLRRLALLQAPVFSGWVAGPLLDQPVAEAADLMEDLADARLVEPAAGSGADGQYRMHELIRVFAAERLAAGETEDGRAAALQRALGAQLYLAEQAKLHGPNGPWFPFRHEAPQWPLAAGLTAQLVSDPVGWFERERAALVSGVRQAALAGFTELSWSLAWCVAEFLQARAYFDDWREAVEVALQAARNAGDVRGQAAMLCSRGLLRAEQRQFGPARGDLGASARLCQEASDDRGLGWALATLAYLDRQNGRFEDALRRMEHALALYRDPADHLGAGHVLYNMAQVKLELREPAAASELLAEALRLVRAAGSNRGEAQALRQLGEACLMAGDLAAADAALGQALSIVRDMGDRIGEAYVLQSAGVAKVRAGEFGAAGSMLRHALDLAGVIGDRLALARARAGMAELALAGGGPGEAAVLAQEAADEFQEIGAVPDQARALILLGRAHAAAGDAKAAEAVEARAAALRTRPDGDAEAPQPELRPEPPAALRPGHRGPAVPGIVLGPLLPADGPARTRQEQARQR